MSYEAAALGSSPEAEEAQYRENDDNCSQQTMLFAVCSSQPVERERVVGPGTRTIITFK
jgi:hypothetical protein